MRYLSVIEPLFERKRVLLAGMGGGYDVFTAVPLYFELKAQGIECILANLSFTRELDSKRYHGDQVEFGPFVVEALASRYPEDAFAEALGFPHNYFPEYHLSRWFRTQHQLDVPVYAIKLITSEDAQQLGVEELKAAYLAIVRDYECDAIVLIDAGVDSVLVGNEGGLGTYAEDFLSLLATSKLDLPVYIQCVGLGSEAGIAVDDFLFNLATHTASGAYLGCYHWLNSQYGVQQYLDALSASIPANSTINALIAAAINQGFGCACPSPLKARGLEDGEILVHPLLTLCFYFDARGVLTNRLFAEECRNARSLRELDEHFDAARRQAGLIDARGQYIGPRPYRRSFDELLQRQFTVLDPRES